MQSSFYLNLWLRWYFHFSFSFQLYFFLTKTINIFFFLYLSLSLLLTACLEWPAPCKSFLHPSSNWTHVTPVNSMQKCKLWAFSLSPGREGPSSHRRISEFTRHNSSSAVPHRQCPRQGVERQWNVKNSRIQRLSLRETAMNKLNSREVLIPSGKKKVKH